MPLELLPLLSAMMGMVCLEQKRADVKVMALVPMECGMPFLLLALVSTPSAMISTRYSFSKYDYFMNV